MALRVVWTPEASGDLMEVVAFIADDSPPYALTFLERVETAAEGLADFPHQGHIVSEIGLQTIREIPVRGHRLVYGVRRNRITVLAFFRGSRNFPDLSTRLTEFDG